MVVRVPPALAVGLEPTLTPSPLSFHNLDDTKIYVVVILHSLVEGLEPTFGSLSVSSPIR